MYISICTYLHRAPCTRAYRHVAYKFISVYATAIYVYIVAPLESAVVSRRARTGNDDLDVYLSYEFPCDVKRDIKFILLLDKARAARPALPRSRKRGFRSLSLSRAASWTNFFAKFNLIAPVLRAHRGGPPRVRAARRNDVSLPRRKVQASGNYARSTMLR